MTINEAYNAFIDSRLVNCEVKSIEYYEGNLLGFIAWLDSCGISSDSDLNSIEASVLESYVRYLRSKTNSNNHGNLSNVSIKTYFRAVKVFISWANNEGYYCQRLKKISLPKSNPSAIIPLFQDEVDHIIECFDDSIYGLRNSLIFFLMLDAGARMKEVINLRYNDVFLDEGFIVLRDTKNGSSRPIPISDHVSDSIRMYLDASSVSSGYLIRQVRYDGPLTKDSITKAFYNIKKSSGIERVHPHLLRHTFATSFIYYGGDIVNLSYLLGHTSISMSQKYVHLASLYKVTGATVYHIDDNILKRLKY